MVEIGETHSGRGQQTVCTRLALRENAVRVSARFAARRQHQMAAGKQRQAEIFACIVLVDTQKPAHFPVFRQDFDSLHAVENLHAFLKYSGFQCLRHIL